MVDEKLADAKEHKGAILPLKAQTYGNVLTAIESRLDSIENQLNTASELLNQKIYSIAVNNLAPNEWNLDKPLMVTVEQHSEEDFIACFYDADVYGYGDSIPEALDDLKEQLVNQLGFLLEEEKRVTLGPVPRRQLDVLRRHIKKGV